MKSKLTTDFSENSYIYHLNEPLDASGLRFQIQFTGYEEIGNHYRLERQDLQSFMLTLVLKGSFNCIYDKKYYRVPEGSLCFLDCMAPHETWPIEPYNIIYLHVFHPMLSELHRYVTRLASPVVPLKGDRIGFESCVKAIHAMTRENRYDEDEASLLIYEMLLKLKKHVENDTVTLPSVPDFINELISYIEEHYAEDCSLSALARAMNFSQNYLDMLFKRYTGTSLGRYVLLFRLKKSQKLLLETDKSVLQIAIEVGFTDSQALIRGFKKIFDVTPHKFRLQNRAEKREG